MAFVSRSGCRLYGCKMLIYYSTKFWVKDRSILGELLEMYTLVYNIDVFVERLQVHACHRYAYLPPDAHLARCMTCIYVYRASRFKTAIPKGNRFVYKRT